MSLLGLSNHEKPERTGWPFHSSMGLPEVHIYNPTLRDSNPGPISCARDLLKSIFYHQNGRFRCDLKACCLSNFCDRFMNDCQTVMNNVSTTYTTVFHFLITSISSNSQLLNLMNTWKLHNMEYHFYNCSNYLANLQWISSKHPAGAKPFLKLMLTEILPTNINKVIVLDNDILLNIDIIELWNHFENFNEIQSIGIGLEQNPHFQDVMPKLESNWEGYGYNNGVLLFDLSKIRLTLWNELWIVITRNVLDTQGYLTTGEQIPCEWNIQLSEGSDEQRCPVSWLTYTELKKRNYSTIFKQPKLIHINHLIKPNDILLNEIPIEYIDYLDIILKPDLRRLPNHSYLVQPKESHNCTTFTKYRHHFHGLLVYDGDALNTSVNDY
ncbi:unnamed protein product [Schistosoma curassoni]|uniref:Glycosyltransferase-like protein LARGE1 n=1 Tax=Schistosoma curassoni TaxID=6186 RepID=A0A183KKX1_9TREM|nr:unnamed protein product [Schistosoma curassoni]